MRKEFLALSFLVFIFLNAGIVGAQKTINLKSGWNMFSIPVNTLISVDKFSDCGTTEMYHYNPLKNEYEFANVIEPGLGYWIQLNSDCTVDVEDGDLSIDNFPNLRTGWNQVGSPTVAIDFSTITGNCNILDGPYSYNPEANLYQEPSTLEPGNGYWIRVESDCTLGTPSTTSSTSTTSSSSTTSTSSTTTSSTTTTIIKFSIIFVPLNWGGSASDFNNEVDTQMNYFINDIPLSNCPEKLRVTKMDPRTENFDSFTCRIENNRVIYTPFSDLWNFIESMGYDSSDYDVLAGMIRNPPCPPVMGISNGIDSIWVTTQYDIVVAHELGHIFGLVDEYCSQAAGSADLRCDIAAPPTKDYPNPLDADLGCNPYGQPCCDLVYKCGASDGCTCPYDSSTKIADYDDSIVLMCDSSNFCEWGKVHVNYGICCLGNINPLGGRSIMSYVNADGPRAFDDYDIAHLASIEQLNCD